MVATVRRWSNVRATWAIFAAAVAVTVIAGSATAWATVPVGTYSKFTVRTDTSADGRVFGRGKSAQVLGPVSVSPPGTSCGAEWQASVTNNTDFVLHTPTGGNVAESRIDIGQSGSKYLFPGQTAVYCVQFTQLNQIFSVLYDMSDHFATGADAVMLLTDVMGLNTGDSNDLANLISSVANIPDVQRIGACFRNQNPLCLPQAINALMTNASSRDALASALTGYIMALGKSVAQTWLDKQLNSKAVQKQLAKAVGKQVAKDLGKYLTKIITTAWWDVKLIGQVALSPAGYVSFQTAP
jgi:hypothetical protein